jgi:tryptophanyl-tRNA synthetase
VRLNDAAIVPGLDGQKMSKSYENTIPIFLSAAELKQKVARIKTASTPLGQPLDPENDTVFALYRLVASPEDVEAMRQEYLAGSIGYGGAKERLRGAIAGYFGPFREKRTQLEDDIPYVLGVLETGAKRAGEEISETLRLVRDAVGLNG